MAFHRTKNSLRVYDQTLYRLIFSRLSRYNLPIIDGLDRMILVQTFASAVYFQCRQCCSTYDTISTTISLDQPPSEHFNTSPLRNASLVCRGLYAEPFVKVRYLLLYILLIYKSPTYMLFTTHKCQIPCKNNVNWIYASKTKIVLYYLCYSNLYIYLSQSLHYQRAYYIIYLCRQVQN